MGRFGVVGRRFLRRSVRTALGIVTLLSVAVLASPTAANAASTTSGGTASFAEQSQSPPDYIFPFMSLAFFSVYNINQFQYLMYRPLYWFGEGSTPDLNLSLSLADKPVYSNNGTTVTINLKNYKWSNGETVTAQD
ncbi:MAG TPA: ABC transporter substrate-binding protein, partial [Acidimicrobiales bacterium]|nr:ABC transporter substrate-binding protein [Acidimicrobiales bacterium]